MTSKDGNTHWLGRVPKQDTPYTANKDDTPVRLSDGKLFRKLCTVGQAGFCWRCGICGFGCEWARRHPEGGGEQ